MKTLTQSKLMSVFRYSPKSGEFTRILSTSGNTKIGDIAGCADTGGHLRISIEKCTYRAHRLAWLYVYGSFPDGDLDHKNGNPRDNRICNLRICNDSQNQMNRKASSKKMKGVTFHKKCLKFQAQIRWGGKTKYLGLFATEIDAALAYDTAAKNLFREFANPNFIGGAA